MKSKNSLFDSLNRRLLALLFSLVAILAFIGPGMGAQAQSEEVVVLEVSGPVTPAMAGYLQRGLETAEASDAMAVILLLDTPGGLLDATQDIVQLFRASEVPIVVYIMPRGAQAASAGSIITLYAFDSQVFLAGVISPGSLFSFDLLTLITALEVSSK